MLYKMENHTENVNILSQYGTLGTTNLVLKYLKYKKIKLKHTYHINFIGYK